MRAMRIVRKLTDICEEIPHPVLTIGNFDGIHLGHQSIFRWIIEKARAMNGTSGVFTFHPHPLKLLCPSRAPLLITTIEEKVELLEKLGIQMLICLNFTPELARLNRKEFVEEVLWNKIGLRDLVVGHDFAFGRHRQGNIPYLRERGAELGFKVHTMKQVEINGTIVSSSLIRQLILEGNVERVAQLLGHPYSLGGEIQSIDKPHGKNEQFTLGFRPQKKLLPPSGFYTVKVTGGRQSVVENSCCRVLWEPGSPLHLYFSDLPPYLGEGKVLRLIFLQKLRQEEYYTPLLNAK
jgi:riboflavin kinase/FMN adenylyltransferase